MTALAFAHGIPKCISAVKNPSLKQHRILTRVSFSVFPSFVNTLLLGILSSSGMSTDADTRGKFPATESEWLVRSSAFLENIKLCRSSP